MSVARIAVGTGTVGGPITFGNEITIEWDAEDVTDDRRLPRQNDDQPRGDGHD